MASCEISLEQDALRASLACDEAAFSALSDLSWSSFSWRDCWILSIGRSVTPGARPPQDCARSALSVTEPVVSGVTRRGDARSCRAAIGIPAINVIVRAVGVLGTGPEHGIPHEHVSVSPERVVKPHGQNVKARRSPAKKGQKTGPPNHQPPQHPRFQPPLQLLPQWFQWFNPWFQPRGSRRPRVPKARRA